jgi:hypothetical protein
VGAYQKTFQSARLVNGHVEMLQTYPYRQFDGDGTVSEVAAIPPEMEPDDSLYVAQRHASLQNTRTALDHAMKILAGKPISDLRAPDLSTSLEIRDAYAAGARVEAVVQAGFRVQGLSIRLEEAMTRRQVQRTEMKPTENAIWVARLDPLRPGVCRLVGGPDLTHPIADVFALFR